MTNVLRELAFEARQLKAQEKEAEKTPENITAPPKNEYTLTVAEYPDIVITKTMARGTKSLILMVSAGAAFIKAEINGREPVSEALNEDNYRNFLPGCRTSPCQPISGQKRSPEKSFAEEPSSACSGMTRAWR